MPPGVLHRPGLCPQHNPGRLLWRWEEGLHFMPRISPFHFDEEKVVFSVRESSAEQEGSADADEEGETHGQSGVERLSRFCCPEIEASSSSSLGLILRAFHYWWLLRCMFGR